MRTRAPEVMTLIFAGTHLPLRCRGPAADGREGRAASSLWLYVRHVSSVWCWCRRCAHPKKRRYSVALRCFSCPLLVMALLPEHMGGGGTAVFQWVNIPTLK